MDRSQNEKLMKSSAYEREVAELRCLLENETMFQSSEEKRNTNCQADLCTFEQKSSKTSCTPFVLEAEWQPSASPCLSPGFRPPPGLENVELTPPILRSFDQETSSPSMEIGAPKNVPNWLNQISDWEQKETYWQIENSFWQEDGSYWYPSWQQDENILPVEDYWSLYSVADTCSQEEPLLAAAMEEYLHCWCWVEKSWSACGAPCPWAHPSF